MKHVLLSICSLILLGLSLTSQAAIYKCFDELGRPVYSAQPTCKNPKEMDKVSHKQREKKRQAELVQEEKKQKKREKECKTAKENLKRYKRAPFLTKMSEDDKGRKVKVRLSKQETDDVLLSAEKEVAFWCNDPISSEDN